ncbi:MAG: AAA family ATPase [bacterium]
MKEPFIKELFLKNLLSFGPETEPLKLRPLNVLIGANGTGKSNLLEAISLLRSAPVNLSAPVKEGGGVSDWLWKGAKSPTATIEAIIRSPESADLPIRHCFSFVEHAMRFEMTEEKIEFRDPYPGYNEPYHFYKMENGHPRLFERKGDCDEERPLQREMINPEQSILSQIKDPERYPLLAYLTDRYAGIRIYREWSFGRYTAPRQPQRADFSDLYLTETCENLGLVLNSLRRYVKREIIDALNYLYPGIDDFNIQIKEGWFQLHLEEGKFSIPATRLSDGTLRYLCMLAILCHPEPPPLVCIEEPELGLHPDVLPRMAELMVAASERTQLIVTTHSDILVDALTETPESVIVCNKQDESTLMQRLDESELSEWLEKYRLGQLWLKGEIGGTRW